MQKKILLTCMVSAVGIGLAFSVLATPSLFTTLDFVNIGDVVSEAGHNLVGWGPKEPETNNGNWGKIVDNVMGSDCDLEEGKECDALCRVVYSGNNPIEIDSPDSRSAYVTLNKVNGWGPKKVRMRFLDGIADDDFMVFVQGKKGDWVLADEYDSDPSTTEYWVVREFNLPFSTWNTKPIELRIMATASDWSSKDTFGQLGIDWIELVGPGLRSGKK